MARPGAVLPAYIISKGTAFVESGGASARDRADADASRRAPNEVHEGRAGPGRAGPAPRRQGVKRALQRSLCGNRQAAAAAILARHYADSDLVFLQAPSPPLAAPRPPTGSRGAGL